MDSSTHNSIMSVLLMLLILVIEAMGQKETDEVSESFIQNMDFRVREKYFIILKFQFHSYFAVHYGWCSWILGWGVLHGLSIFTHGAGKTSLSPGRS